MSITAKRKIQELVRNGKLQDAVEVLRQATGEADADPYDHVYLGDLLMRLGETEDALASYQRSIRSYEAVGLNRNAVAIGKKLLRIDPTRAEVHRGLAQLYERDGLASEALPHFLAFLDSFSGEQIPPTEFLEALDQAASLTGARVEVALRLADHFQRIHRIERAAELLADVAGHAERAGSPEIAADLRDRARELERSIQSEDSGLESTDGLISPSSPSISQRHALGSETPAASVLFELGEAPDERAFSVEEEGIEQRPAIAAAAMDAIGSALAEAVEEMNAAASVFGEAPLQAEGLADFDGAIESGQIESGQSESGFGDLFEDDGGTSFETARPELPASPRERFIIEHFPSAKTDGAQRSSVAAGESQSRLPRSGPRQIDRVEDSSDPSEDSSDPFSPVAREHEGTGATRQDWGASRHDTSASPQDRGASRQNNDGLRQDDGTSRADAFPIQNSPPTRTGAEFALPKSLDVHSNLGPTQDTAHVREPIWEIEDETIEPLDLRPVDEDMAAADSLPDSSLPEDQASPFDAEEVESLAEAAFLSGGYAEARRLYESLPHERLENRKILAKLVECVRHLGDPLGEAMYLCRLGDAWIADNEYEEALECFLDVLKLDPKNVNAQRRLAKFRELGVRGTEGIPESDSHSLPGILETGRTEVAVKSGEEFRSEDWIELSGLLEEFKSGLKNQMDASDHQAHYDLAVSHHSMGLLDEALEEIEIALGNPAMPPELERRARELKASCLMELQRFREAVHEYREAADDAHGDRSARRAALYNLGRALESVEEWREASETYLRLKVEAPGFLDLEDRIRACEQHLPNGGGASGLSAA